MEDRNPIKIVIPYILVGLTLCSLIICMIFFINKVSVLERKIGNIENSTANTLVDGKDFSDQEIPQYYFENDYLKNKITDIDRIASASENIFTFGLITDLHINDNALYSMNLMKYISDQTQNVPFVISCGDIPVTASENKTELYRQIATWQNMMSLFGKDKVYQVRGNHDFLCVLYEKDQFSYQYAYGRDIYKYIMGNIEDSVIHPYGKCYYYFDVPKTNIRIVVLDDYETEVPVCPTQVQYDWLINQALNANDKSIVIFSHESSNNKFPSYRYNLEPLQYIYRAFRNKTKLNYYRQGISLTYDFSKNTSELICNFVGHIHRDYDDVDSGVLTIASNCDAKYNDQSKLDRSFGTIYEQSFDIVSIDTTNRKISMTRIGAGNDRVFNY